MSDIEKEPLVLGSVVRKTFPFALVDSAGAKQRYSIRELLGPQRDVYMKLVSERMKFDDAGKPIGVRNQEGLQASLLEKCVLDDAGTLVKRNVIDSWPATTTQSVFEKALELSGLTEEAAEALGNG